MFAGYFMTEGCIMLGKMSCILKIVCIWCVIIYIYHFRCVIQIQKHFIAEWWGLSKAAARNNAAYRALSVLAHADHHFVKVNYLLVS